jgi:hypothetical protein
MISPRHSAKHRWTHWTLTSLLLLAIMAVAFLFSPAAHASGVNYQTNQGRWHTSLAITYEVDSGHVTAIINAHCWIDDYPNPSTPFGTNYHAQCDLLYRTPSGIWYSADYQVASASHYEPYHNPAAQWAFGTQYSGTGYTWDVQITTSYICLNYGQNRCVTVDHALNAVETEVTV